MAQFRGAALYKRSSWKKSVDESKIDMGLMDPFSQEALDFSLFTAVVEDNHRAIREMVAQGANPNMTMPASSGDSAGALLHYAVRHASLKAVIALLQHGANPFVRDAAGITPRDVAKQRLSGNKMRTVLKIWEQRKASPQQLTDAAIDFTDVMREAS